MACACPWLVSQALHMAKAIVQLVCLPSLVVRVASHPKFVACWTIFARHDDAQVRLRAAKIFNKVIAQPNDAMGYAVPLACARVHARAD